MTTRPLPRVIIIQTSRTDALGASALLRRMLENAKLGENDGICFPLSPESARFLITQNLPQLLITGSFHGDANAADTFTLEMKEKNPILKACYFSSIDVGEPREIYNEVLSKDLEGCQKLVGLIKEFLTTGIRA